MKRFRTLLRLSALAVLLTLCSTLPAEKFTYKYQKGDKFRFLSTVDEYVYRNRRLDHHSEIVNRIAFEISDVKDKAGRLSGNFQTSERQAGTKNGYIINFDYDSDFWRDALGIYDIDDKYFMPVVRNVPVFPDRDLKAGDTWTFPGEEKHDFRYAPYGIPDPYEIPFTAQYEYLGEKPRDGKNLPLFKVSYTIFYEPPVPKRYSTVYPQKIMGYSEQYVYWDRGLGQPSAYEERFKIIFDLSSGDTFEFTGTAQSVLIEAKTMDRGKVEKDVQAEIKRLGIPDATVRQDAKGIVISLEDIKFQSDSAVLLDSEKRKLDKIGQILKGYPDRDLLITGHTALAGTEEGRQQLSEERAATVADYLRQLGVRTQDRMLLRGKGATEPVADNSSEAGMKRNRRVEITILEN
jgi:outer membrane protein OmpA-like peptidoglycan-associated protein